MHDARPGAERAPDDDAVVLDDGGLLRCGGRWVAIPDAQLPIVELLVRNFGALVPIDDVRDAHEAAGGVVTPNAIRSLVHRIRQRASAVGLTLHVVRARGVVLDRG